MTIECVVDGLSGEEGGVMGGVKGRSTISVVTALMFIAMDRLADKMVWQWGHGK